MLLSITGRRPTNPHFASEVEAARWHDRHRRELEQRMERRLPEGTVLTLEQMTERGAGRDRRDLNTSASGPAPLGRSRRGVGYWLSYARSLLITNNLIYLYLAVLSSAALAGSFVDSQGRWQHGCARLWGWLILKTSRVRVRVEGLEHLKGQDILIFCVNHPSAMDIAILLASLPVQFRFVAKQELFRLPFLGWFLRRAGHIAVERGRPHEAKRSFEEAAARIRRGTSVVLFPEGTRSRRAGVMLPFKAGTFYLAIQAGVPVLPITLNGTRHTHEPDTLHIRGGQTEMIIHEPIPTEGLNTEDVQALSQRVREKILSRFVPGSD
jgi:1-acyl-sn-glycerol-3-phosphate acyltransferase